MDKPHIAAPKIGSFELEVGPQLAEGRNGVVFQGTCRGHTVAIKELKKFNADRRDEFIAEIEVLATLVHPNIVLLMGAYTETKWLMVFEFCTLGNLHALLHSRKIKLSLQKKIRFGLEICSGMAWLTGEKVKIVHRQLNTKNIMVDVNQQCKVGGFGLSLLQSKGVVKQGRACTLRGFPAPETRATGTMTVKSDVYSFGFVLWELLTQQTPFQTTSLSLSTDELAEILSNDQTPPLPGKVPIIEKIISSCWDQDPEARPDFVDLISILQRGRIDLFLPASLCSLAGAFWKTKWPHEDKIKFDVFFSSLCEYLGRPQHPLQKICLAAVFSPPESSAARHVRTMSLSKFGKLLKWFGPLRQGEYCILDTIMSYLQSPWFMGLTNREAAEAKLAPFGPGTFLVRLNAGTTEPIEIAPYTLTRVHHNDFIHTRVCSSKKGGLYIKTDATQIRTEGTLMDLIKLLGTHPDSPFHEPCPKNPFDVLFCTAVAPNYIFKPEED